MYHKVSFPSGKVRACWRGRMRRRLQRSCRQLLKPCRCPGSSLLMLIVIMLMFMYIVHGSRSSWRFMLIIMPMVLYRYGRSWPRVIKKRSTLALKYRETRKKNYAKKRVNKCCGKKYVRNVIFFFKDWNCGLGLLWEGNALRKRLKFRWGPSLSSSSERPFERTCSYIGPNVATFCNVGTTLKIS